MRFLNSTTSTQSHHPSQVHPPWSLRSRAITSPPAGKRAMEVPEAKWTRCSPIENSPSRTLLLRATPQGARRSLRAGTLAPPGEKRQLHPSLLTPSLLHPSHPPPPQCLASTPHTLTPLPSVRHPPLTLSHSHTPPQSLASTPHTLTSVTHPPLTLSHPSPVSGIHPSHPHQCQASTPHSLTPSPVSGIHHCRVFSS